MHPTAGALFIAAEPTVYMEFTSDQEQGIMDSRLFWSGIGFGISIPLIVSGLAELVKDDKPLVPRIVGSIVV